MYSTRADLEAIIPPQFIVQALDDNGDSTEDDGLFAIIAASADAQIDGYLSGRYATPFSPVPPLVRECAKVFIAESLYQRRGYNSEANPYTARANQLRKQLESIGNGNGSLGGVSESGSSPRPPISIVTEPSRTTPTFTING